MTLFPFTPGARGANVQDVYRYDLWRGLAGDQPRLLFVMLNPSTADATQDDATIRRCLGFARREHAHRLDVVNLYALRARNPARLDEHPDPVGPLNDTVIAARALETVQEAGKIVLAYGALRRPAHAVRAARVTTLLRRTLEPYTGDLWCLGRTASGAPRHPLYVRSDAPLLPIP